MLSVPRFPRTKDSRSEPINRRSIARPTVDSALRPTACPTILSSALAAIPLVRQSREWPRIAKRNKRQETRAKGSPATAHHLWASTRRQNDIPRTGTSGCDFIHLVPPPTTSLHRLSIFSRRNPTTHSSPYIYLFFVQRLAYTPCTDMTERPLAISTSQTFEASHR